MVAINNISCGTFPSHPAFAKPRHESWEEKCCSINCVHSFTAMGKHLYSALSRTLFATHMCCPRWFVPCVVVSHASARVYIVSYIHTSHTRKLSQTLSYVHCICMHPTLALSTNKQTSTVHARMYQRTAHKSHTAYDGRQTNTNSRTHSSHSTQHTHIAHVCIGIMRDTALAQALPYSESSREVCTGARTTNAHTQRIYRERCRQCSMQVTGLIHAYRLYSMRQRESEHHAIQSSLSLLHSYYARRSYAQAHKTPTAFHMCGAARTHIRLFIIYIYIPTALLALTVHNNRSQRTEAQITYIAWV